MQDVASKNAYFFRTRSEDKSNLLNRPNTFSFINLLTDKIYLKTEKIHKDRNLCGFRGALEGTRTPDLLVRSQSLYPAELQAHFSNSFIIISSKVQYVNPFLKKTSNFLRKSYFSQKYLHRHFYCGIVCPKTLFVPFTPTRFHLGGVYYDRSYRI